MTFRTAVVAGPRAATDAARTGAPAGPPPRLAWLDALRGFAALVVAYYHLSPYLLGGLGALFTGWLWTGRYGVVLFFLVSGFVIPMSLERYGNLRRFWVGRIFRIYPAWLLTVVVALIAVAVLPHRRLAPALAGDPVTAVLAHVTMLQELLGVPSLVNVLWTLSYEMVFYLLMSGLFVLGLHRRCGWWAVGLTMATLLGGRLLPDALLTGGRPGVLLPAVFAVLVTASVAGYLWGHRGAALLAAGAGLGMVLLPALNGAPAAGSHADASWQSLSFLAVMFAGTVVYAAVHGRLERRHAALTLAVVLAGLLAAAWWHTPQAGQSAALVARVRGEAVGTLLAVAATFALGYALRHRRVPGWASWLGRISYSLYLLHPVVLWVLLPHFPDARHRPLPVQLAIGALYLGTTLVVAALAHRYVERPGQALGRRVARRLDRGWGADHGPQVPPTHRHDSDVR